MCQAIVSACCIDGKMKEKELTIVLTYGNCGISGKVVSPEGTICRGKAGSAQECCQALKKKIESIL